MSLKKSVMLVDDTHNVCKIIAVNNNPNFSSSLNSISEQYEILISANYPVLTKYEVKLFTSLILFMKDKKIIGIESLVNYFSELINYVLTSDLVLEGDLFILKDTVNKIFENKESNKSKTFEKIQGWNQAQILSVIFMAKRDCCKILNIQV